MITTRKARADDAEDILEYSRIMGGETDNLSFGPEGVSLSLLQEQEFLEATYANPKQLYLVAYDGNKLVGAVTLATSNKPRMEHRAELGISVRKKWWGKGLGTRLMEEAIAYARDVAHLEMITLTVNTSNVRAIELYRKFGFTRFATFTNHSKIGGVYADCDLMSLKL
ncbi:GNAT family N-acetyltransferase [Timonella senegalensis]|uniref:GNAT family N-acetyltransferase n=1 Tax=Timonella senegalensis TaxID=1465825 RepID=UPI0028B1DE5C|nr:GNAT family protein [Timonella senegalensis]